MVITDDANTTFADGTSTPATENNDDDFFSSWDKPAIKRPSNPPSRVGTPPVVSRSQSPFLSAPNANGAAVGRPKSPLNASAAAVADAASSLPAPQAIRTSPSSASSASAIRKTPTSTTAAASARKPNILGAKKTTTKLGAKKIVGEEIDFEAAEKAAKAEADRKEKLGYDPDAEQKEADKTRGGLASTAKKPEIAANVPVPSVNNTTVRQQGHQRSPSEVERLGMGVARLGFGQVGKTPGSSTAAAPKKLGFGSVGVTKAAPVEGKPIRLSLHLRPSPVMLAACRIFDFKLTFTQTTKSTHARNSELKKAFPATNSSAATHSTPLLKARPRRDYKTLTAQQAYPPTRTLADRKTTSPKEWAKAT